MSTEAYDDRRPLAPRSPSACVLRIRVTEGEYAGMTGILWSEGASKAEVDLGPAGGWVDIPADWIEVLDD